MLSLTGFKFRFTPSLRMMLLTFVVIALFVRLGFWQLDRAFEKKQMIALQTKLAKRGPVAWFAGDSLPLQYQAVRVQGHFMSPIFLLDNQSHQHYFGYDVLSPLVLTTGQVILVDRGFVAADVRRLVLPQVDVPAGLIQVVGSVYFPSEKNWLLGQVVEKKQAEVTIVELIDTKIISQLLHKSVYPFIIRLGPDEAHGFKREWSVVSMPPVRHYGYAVQWFAMATVILIIFIALNSKKIPK
ncbi:SURF1 family protein [bacterium]|nr:SURF1 family protein [bacterium]